jgi:hypothetical protein
MFKSKPHFSVTISRGVLESIFDECDKYDSHETGGRLIGTYQKKGARYDIQLSGVLGPGPNARRSSTSFFQDGDYQERVFRSIEESHPEVEHLGNWHTHHCNGLDHLSEGDHATYRRNVNHDKHNTDFFYALLVTRRNSESDLRYNLRHYFFRRNDEKVYETPEKDVQIINGPVLWPPPGGDGIQKHFQQSEPHTPPNVERVKDQEFFSDFYPSLKALLDKKGGAVYWKGPLTLIDGSNAEVLAMENVDDGRPSYLVTAKHREHALSVVLTSFRGRQFRSARHAVWQLQADLNQAIYRHGRGER